jgi:drug/metabolite transporter (DMT)-like permease
VFEAIMILAHVLAIVQTNVAYMIAVKRTSMLFGLAYGAWWFGERQLAQRLAGMLVMLVGVALTVAG